MPRKNGVYKFNWNDLGDIQLGRPNLGNLTNVAVYRLMQYTMRSVLEEELGYDQMKNIFFKSGKLAGQEYCKNILDITLDSEKFIATLHSSLKELGIGILYIENFDRGKLSFVLTVSEDLDCSGLPVYGVSVCDYDEGFLTGIFETYYGIEFQVKEIDCWATGERTCRFSIDKISG